MTATRKFQLLGLLLVAACGGPPKPTPELVPLDPKPTPAPEVAWSELAGPITTITVKTDDQTQIMPVKQTLAEEVGKPIDRRRLRAKLAQLIGARGIADVTANAVQQDDGIELVIAVWPQPALHALTAHEAGGAELPLPGQLATATGLPLDPGLLDAVVTQLREQYQAKGYTEVAATWQDTPAGKGQVDVAIEVTPGKASTITTIEMKGNTHEKKAALLAALGAALSPNSPWITDSVEKAVVALTAYYYEHGYINVAIEPPKPSGAAEPATFTITEGDQYRIGKLKITNASPADVKKYLAMIPAKQGDVFVRSKMQQGVQKLEEAVKGAIEPTTHIDAKTKTIDIEFALPKPAPKNP